MANIKKTNVSSSNNILNPMKEINLIYNQNIGSDPTSSLIPMLSQLRNLSTEAQREAAQRIACETGFNVQFVRFNILRMQIDTYIKANGTITGFTADGNPNSFITQFAHWLVNKATADQEAEITQAIFEGCSIERAWKVKIMNPELDRDATKTAQLLRKQALAVYRKKGIVSVKSYDAKINPDIPQQLHGWILGQIRSELNKAGARGINDGKATYVDLARFPQYRNNVRGAQDINLANALTSRAQTDLSDLAGLPTYIFQSDPTTHLPATIADYIHMTLFNMGACNLTFADDPSMVDYQTLVMRPIVAHNNSKTSGKKGKPKK